MKKLVLLVLLQFCFLLSTAENDVGTLRKYFYASANNKFIAEEFLNQTKNITDKGEPLLVGFKAMSLLMICNHVSNPFAKLSYFKDGKKLLEQAIKRDPTNAELIFFRFSTQTNVPAVLSYSSDIDNDKIILMNYLRTSSKLAKPDLVLCKKIKDYLLSSKYCTADEKLEINRIMTWA